MIQLLSFFTRKPGYETKFALQLKEVLAIETSNTQLYRTALSHRSVKETTDENNERLEYLGDAILSAIVADYLFKRYPYKGEGYLTEMRSKMVNRQQLNDIALRMGLRKLTFYNKFENTLEALVGAVYLDKGYRKTQHWVLNQVVLPHMFVDDLESVDINLKNKLIGWANKTGKTLSFELVDEKREGNRRLFQMDVLIDGETIASGKGYNKKDASQQAAQAALLKLGI